MRKAFFTRQGLIVQRVPNVLTSLKSVAIKEQNGDIIAVTKGSFCKIQAESGNEWIMEVSDIFMVGPVDTKYFLFVNGTYFIPTLNNGQIIHHEWTKTPQLIPRTYTRDSIQPTSRIKTKVMIYPEPANIVDPSYFLCIDVNNLNLTTEVCVPVYPRVHDNLFVKGTRNQLWFCQVKEVQRDNKRVTVQWYQETRRSGVWTLINHEDTIPFSSIINLCSVKKTFGGYSITDS